MANNTFGEQAKEEAGLFGGQPPSAAALEDGGSGNSSCYIDGEGVRVVIVRVREGRIADWKGGVKDWVVLAEDEIRRDTDGSAEAGGGQGRGRRPEEADEVLTNGIHS